MRIIAGKHRGLVLAQFGGEAIRPTPDRVKESVFQILSDRLPSSRVLDLFCGSGALGIEALSRGAREAVFNDISRESLRVLERNLKAAKERGKTTCSDFETCLLGAEGKFGIVFCDPPYKADFCTRVLTLLRERSLMEEGGIVVYESEREEVPPEGWVRADLRRYGRTKVSFFALDERREG